MQSLDTAELDLATVQENYRKRINQYIKCNLLILDERLLIGTNKVVYKRQDIYCFVYIDLLSSDKDLEIYK